MEITQDQQDYPAWVPRNFSKDLDSTRQQKMNTSHS